jgi:uncharacterized protein (TIGR02118 family)
MIVSVTYPNTPGSHFDQDYYLKTHLPLVHARWGHHGLRGVQVVSGTGTPDGSTPPTRVVVLLDFESPEGFASGVAAHGEEIMGDVPNFTDIKPVMQFNETLS